ncbi:amino acid adenylation domain-containing protein [Aliikangiella sp. IMCC44359]|uniref:amino acid adenylation domain-containing protein n=1 Tax=Aliikangiella sp. IMCC44359 TaxID=3459125 RepID=UPI00403ADA72
MIIDFEDDDYIEDKDINNGLDIQTKLSDEEKFKILYQWNNTQTHYNQEQCLHQLFELQVCRTPDLIATECNGMQVSYQVLNQRANQLARYFVKQGMKAEQLIGICVERSHNMIAALLGILKVGAAYVPLEASQSKGRIKTVVDKADIELIVTTNANESIVKNIESTKLLNIDSDINLISSQSVDNLNSANCNSNNLAYIIFTSGSTGTPKGVAVKHKPVINLIEWVKKAFHIGTQDVGLFTTSLGFDLSVFDVFGLLAVGAKIRIVSDSEKKETKTLANILMQERITFWNSAPAALQLLVPFFEEQKSRITNSKLRLVFLSGDWIPLSLPDSVRQFFSAAKVISLGGATEATVWSNFFPIEDIDPNWRSIPYGKPIQNARYYILDENLNPCAIGEEGDLYIGGDCLSEGYLNEPELTKNAFISDPYNPDSDKKMYKTGDLARFYADGNIEFLGRSDFQVKIRGFRIELCEIEYKLRSHKDIKEAVVVVREDTPGDQKLVAYVITNGQQMPVIKELREFLAQDLPDYMLPNIVTEVTSYPTTSNGKVDRKALPWPVTITKEKVVSKSNTININNQAFAAFEATPLSDNGPIDSAFTFVNQELPKQIVEFEAIIKQLTNFLKEQLSCDNINIDADLFDFGATSLNIINLAREIQKIYGVELSIEEVLKSPNIEAICHYIMEEMTSASNVPLQDHNVYEAQQQEELTQHFNEIEKAQLSNPVITEWLEVFLSERLGCANLDITKDLFDYGATSLNIIQLAQAVQKKYQVELLIEDVLQSPSIEAISAIIISHLKDLDQTSEILLPEKNSSTTINDAQSPLIEKHNEFHAILSINSLSRLLNLLREITLDGKAKYLYPASGGLYAIQTYLSIDKGKIPGLDGGIYYYHPVHHRLYKINEQQSINKSVYHPYYHPAVEQSALAIFFVAQLKVIRPLYKKLSNQLVRLDTGYMAELLKSNQAYLGIQIEEVLGVDFESIRPLFSLDESHSFTLCLLGSLTQPSLNRQESFVDFMQTNALSFTTHFNTTDSREQKIVPEEDYASVDLNELKKLQWNLRPVEQKQWIDLKAHSLDKNRYLRRSTQRNYESASVLQESLYRLLALLKSNVINDFIEVFISIKAQGTVEGLAEGFYRYDPKYHKLIFISDEVVERIRSCHYPFNRKHYDQSAFSLYLFADIKKLQPIYGEQSEYIVSLYAGMLGQRFMDHQAEQDIGLCPIGGVLDTKGITEHETLAKEYTLLQCFIGGTVYYSHGQSESKDIYREQQNKITDAEKRDKVENDIAIIGMACRFPQANNVDEFWHNLAAGRSSLTAPPEQRKEIFKTSVVDQSDGNIIGGFLSNIQHFDNTLFKISPLEAKTMDPQERLLLELAWECLENSGYQAESLNQSTEKVGVFVGAMWADYQNHGVNTDPEQYSLPTSFHSAIANRISYFFDFKGPSIMVDTSCSSGMTAIHLACESIKRGECETALVAAVNLVSHAQHVKLLQQLDLLSLDNQNFSFSADATGWAVGEGAAAILIRAKSKAILNKDSISALLKASSIGHTGKTTRYSIPSATAFTDSIASFLSAADIAADSISYVECAAPGASMPDAAEMTALGNVFAKRSNEAACLIGSVKANIGHLESASAFSQLFKVIMQSKHQQIAPSLFNGKINPLSKFDASKIKIVQQLQAWDSPENSPRRSMINTLGASGSCGHLLVEEYIAPAKQAVIETASNSPVLIVLSAASAVQRDKQVTLLLQHIQQSIELPIKSISYTLLAGRKAMQYRFATVVNNIVELQENLKSYLNGNYEDKAIYQGHVADNNETPEEHINVAQVHQFAQEWCQGRVKLIYPEKEQRIALPSYPFEENNYWFTDERESDQVGQEPTEKVNNMDNIISQSESFIDNTENKNKVEQYVKSLFSQASGVAIQQIDLKAPLENYGVNSLIVTRMGALMSKDIEGVSKVVLFEHQTLAEVVDLLLQNHFSALKEQLSLTDFVSVPVNTEVKNVATQFINNELPSAANHHSSGDIAIIGLSGRYPQADNIEQFWENLRQGKNCITEIPKNRWDASQQDCRWGGFIADHDKFSPLFFNITPKEAETIDPQERIFLELSWELFEDAGYSPEDLKEKYQGDVGVFVGVMYGEYQFYGIENTLKGQPTALTSAYGSVANRVSHFYDFHGPSMAIDTMCSSSLTALHLAVESIRNQDCQLAVVGGVNLTIHPNKYIMLSQLHMSSNTGSCKSFGGNADGFVPGEGGGAILLKPLEQAILDGDNIQGVIKSTSTNHGGRTSGYTVPNPKLQADLISKSLKKANIDPATLSYVEAHGTGTSLGDPIEISGLTQAFSPYTKQKQFCAVGSVKSNIGHLEAASGIAGITKVLLQMKHKTLVPSLHVDTLNPNIDFNNTPFYVQNKLESWSVSDPQSRRRASVSSFGSGGANANVILEEYPQQEWENIKISTEQIASQQLILLSAKSASQLCTMAKNLKDYVSLRLDKSPSISASILANIAFTLQVGRSVMDEKLAILCSSLSELYQKLADFVEGKTNIDKLYVWQKSSSKKGYQQLLEGEAGNIFISTLLKEQRLDKLLKLWGDGGKIDWYKINRNMPARKISLPCYPFERQVCWVKSVPDKAHALTTDSVVQPKDMTELKSLTLSSKEVLPLKLKKDNKVKAIFLQSQWDNKPLNTATFQENAHYILFDKNAQLFDEIKKVEPDFNLKLADINKDVYSENKQSFDEFFRRIIASQNNVVERRPLKLVFMGAALQQAESSIEEAHKVATQTMLNLMQSVISQNFYSSISLLYCATPSKSDNASVSDGMSGFFKSLAQEISNFNFKVINATAFNWDMIKAELADNQNDEVSYLNKQRYTKRLIQTPISAVEPLIDKQTYLKRNGVYLISGGMGKLGLIFARHLAKQTKSTIVLFGRSTLTEQMKSTLLSLQETGSIIVYRQVNLSCQEEVIKFANDITHQWCNINGIIHAAGLIKDSLLNNKSAQDIQDVLTSKLLSAYYLDEAFKDHNLDFFILFSSLVATMGNIGQGDYAYANACLEQFAVRRNECCQKQRRYGKTLAIGWPFWSEGGMLLSEKQLKALEDKTGLVPLTTQQGLAIFDELLDSSFSNVAVAFGYEKKLREYLKISPNSRLTLLRKENDNAHSIVVHKQQPIINKTNIRQFLRSSIATTLSITEAELQSELSFEQLAINPPKLITLIESIAAEYSLKLYPPEFMIHNNLDKLTEYIAEELLIQDEEDSTQNVHHHTLTHVNDDTQEGSQDFTDTNQKLFTQSKQNAQNMILEIKNSIAKITGLTIDSLDNDIEFSDLGMNSIMLVDLAEQLDKLYQVRLYPSELQLYDTIAKLSSYIESEVAELLKSIKTDSLLQQSETFSEKEQGSIITEIKSSIAEITGLTIDNLDNDIEFSDLGMNSIMLVDLTERLDKLYQIRLYPSELQLYNTISQLADYVSNEITLEPMPTKVIRNSHSPVTQSNIFLLSTPRSGSTMLRVMLMGHSEIFSPPELHLLQFDTLGQRLRFLKDKKQEFLREGFIESIKTLKGIDSQSAIEIMDELEKQDLTIKEAYQYLNKLYEGKYIIDKSPTYADELKTLKNSVNIDENALYIFLIRHPIAMMESFVRNRFNKMLNIAGDPWKIAEDTWCRMNQNIQEFLLDIPAERKFFLHYENLVQQPVAVLQNLCSSLGFEFEESMLNLFDVDRMLNGLHSNSMTIGDPGFLSRKKIDPQLAFEWKKHIDRIENLNTKTLMLAKELGYSDEQLCLNHYSRVDR